MARADLILKARNIIAWTMYLFGFCVIWILIPKILKFFGCRIWYFSRLGSRIGLFLFGVRMTVEGVEQIEANQGYVFVANHRSWFDQLALCAALPVQLHFFANIKYFQQFLLGSAMHLYEHIPVDPSRSKGMSETERDEVVALLKAGHSLVVYPEGTRNTCEELLPFKHGIFQIAAQAGAPIIPVWILGMETIYPRKAPLLSVRPGVVNLHLGHPVSCQSQSWRKSARDFEGEFKRVYALKREGRVT